MKPPDDRYVAKLLAELDLPANSVPRLEAAIREADTRGDIDLAFRLRLKVFEQGYPDVRKFVAFSWCLGHFNRDRQRFGFATAQLIHGLDWISAVAYAYPQFTLEQIWGMLEQLRDFRQSHGHSLRPVYEKFWRTALCVGDEGKLRRYFALWKRTPADDGRRCPACESHIWLDYWSFRNKHERAVAAGEPNLAQRSCYRCEGFVPWNLCKLLRSLVQVGRPQDAEEAYRHSSLAMARALSHGGDSNLYLYALAQQLAYLRHTANFSKGVDLLEKHLPVAQKTDDIDNRYRFYTVSAAFLRRLAEDRASASLRLPQTFPQRNEEGRYALAALADCLEEQTAALGAAFNKRNGNQHYVNMVREQLIY
jgi:hypothetical protein